MNMEVDEVREGIRADCEAGGQLAWGTCTECIIMPTRKENKCCQHEDLNSTCLPEYEPGRCILSCEDIVHCLSKASVRHSWLDQQRYLGVSGAGLLFCNMSNRHYRHHAYHRYVNYIYWLLGRYNRKVILHAYKSFKNLTL